MANTGTEYEKLIQAIFDTAIRVKGLKSETVLHDTKLDGITRDEYGVPTKHQIDVYWEFELASVTYRTVVQAKDWQTRVTKEKVLAFKAVLNDLPGQPRGIMISRSGFQSGAEAFAREHGIELYILDGFDAATAGLDNINISGAHFNTRLEDIILHFDESWVEKHADEIERLMKNFDPHTAVLQDLEMTETRPFSSVFENISNTAVLAKETGRVLNAFDRPVTVRSPAMESPVVIMGVSAVFVAEETVSPLTMTLDVSRLFFFILKRVTGNDAYFVDQDHHLHEAATAVALCVIFARCPRAPMKAICFMRSASLW